MKSTHYIIEVPVTNEIIQVGSIKECVKLVDSLIVKYNMRVRYGSAQSSFYHTRDVSTKYKHEGNLIKRIAREKHYQERCND